jgi:hypothetical protein
VSRSVNYQRHYMNLYSQTAEQGTRYSQGQGLTRDIARQQRGLHRQRWQGQGEGQEEIDFPALILVRRGMVFRRIKMDNAPIKAQV